MFYSFTKALHINEKYQSLIGITAAPAFPLEATLCNVNQGSPNFFVRGPHKLLHNSSRAGHMCNAIVSVYVTFYQINKFFVNMLFFHYWQNGFAGRILYLETPDVNGCRSGRQVVDFWKASAYVSKIDLTLMAWRFGNPLVTRPSLCEHLETSDGWAGVGLPSFYCPKDLWVQVYRRLTAGKFQGQLVVDKIW